MKASVYPIQYLTILIGLTASLCSIPAFAGDKTGNGGDMCEDHFKMIRDDLSEWLRIGGEEALRLPFEVTPQKYSSQMRSVLGAKINCTTDKIFLGGVEKTCRNSDDAGVRRIECNILRFEQMNHIDQYTLVHHEYAGLASLEINDGDGSHYGISNLLAIYMTQNHLEKLSGRTSFQTDLETAQAIHEFLKNPAFIWSGSGGMGYYYDSIEVECSNLKDVLSDSVDTCYARGARGFVNEQAPPVRFVSLPGTNGVDLFPGLVKKLREEFGPARKVASSTWGYALIIDCQYQTTSGSEDTIIRQSCTVSVKPNY